MTIVADRVDAVIGVDTHTDTHSAAIVTSLGAVVAQHRVAADPAGYTQLIAWAANHAPGQRLAWALEGTRAHGIGLTRALHAAGAHVIQAPTPPAAHRRRGGSPTPSTPSRPRGQYWPPAHQRPHAPTAPAKTSASCWPADGTTPTPAPPPSTSSNR